MSAQLVLTDLEMEVIMKCGRSVASQTIPPARLTPEEHAAFMRLAAKILPQLDRTSRRRPRHGR